MAWRFKASKYKNATPMVPKPEACIRDICVGSYQTYGNNIAASAAFIAFNWEHAGSSLAVLPIDDCGRKSKIMPLLQAHSDTVTYMDFSPFHDGLLATGSQDCLVKVWHIPEKGLEQSISNPECCFSTKQRRVETVGFHPTADCLLFATAVGCVSLWDLTNQQEAFSNNEHPEVIQSLGWKQDGKVCATSCKDKMVRVLDPRAQSPIVMVADSHQSIKDSRIVWLGDQNRVLTTGFDASRLRQVIIRDIRNISIPEKTLELDCSTGVLMPLFDPDTNMLFLCGKGDTTINYLEVIDKDPFLIEGIRHSGEQTKGACLVPKRALKVMEGEVNRIIQLTSNSVIPIMYQVPRKSYRDFHSDLFPDTNGYKSELSATQWINGSDAIVPKISLDPAKRELGDSPIIIMRGPLNEVVNNIVNKTRSSKPSYTCAVVNAGKDIIVQPNLVTIKDKIKKMEQQSHTEKCEFEQKFKELTSLKGTKSNKNANRDEIQIDNGIIHHSEHKELGAVDVLNTEMEKQEDTSPPKPLPRTSRNNSVSEFLSGPAEDVCNTAAPRPIARPRTTTASYKPRLGPKPFSGINTHGEFSFDKVFNVPQAPCSEISDKDVAKPAIGDQTLDTNGDQNEECLCLDGIKFSEEVEQGHERNYDSVEDTPVISTAELRKIDINEEKFEKNISTESVDQFDDTVDEKCEFDRQSSQRTSIAERRRMYEGRSQSVQEDKHGSPTLLRRRESLKVRGEQKATDDTDMTSLPSIDFLRNRSDLTKENITDINKRSNNVQSIQNNTTVSKRTSTVFGRVSKFRHLKGTPGQRGTNIENIRNLSRQIPGECDGFHANAERVAVPIAGAGGKIAVLELNKPGRLPDGVMATLVNKQNIMDFQWDPFDAKRLAVACDDGSVKLWLIPDGGLIEPTNEPAAELVAHTDKINIIRFHPLAKNVLLTASSDLYMKIWDLTDMVEKYCLRGHTDQILCFSWSLCGKYGATVAKDTRIRIFEPRKTEQPIREGTGPVGTRGARIVWALEGEYLVVTGFDKVSERQIYVYKATDLNIPVGMVGLDVSPAILMPFYDEDSSTLFATGKGDVRIYCFEITDETPFICHLSHHRCASMTQGLSFLTKNNCDVASVEFAKAQRLTNGTVEALSFTVPRIKSDLFQDDLFPPTKVLWEATLTADEWFAGKDVEPVRKNLQPAGMDALSSINNPTAQNLKKNEPSETSCGYSKSPIKSAEQVKEEIKIAVSARMSVNKTLEQDSMEGVDEKEWEE
ncbi:coronin-7 isoform X1 [Anopheles aquasalis]|uniref:coronin-7 isoform X1 n=1 Tax=Anopheles aquasalis TaxID=42839 RepID=UPI00215B5664|nr:coronin-7 isoform X1 [Anopheles aquasalis]XP_050099193.1 coronin-7 isoform X1 [Anopheles aquasalis]